jgi:hypothetical protein
MKADGIFNNSCLPSSLFTCVKLKDMFLALCLKYSPKIALLATFALNYTAVVLRVRILTWYLHLLQVQTPKIMPKFV